MGVGEPIKKGWELPDRRGRAEAIRMTERAAESGCSPLRWELQVSAGVSVSPSIRVSISRLVSSASGLVRRSGLSTPPLQPPSHSNIRPSLQLSLWRRVYRFITSPFRRFAASSLVSLLNALSASLSMPASDSSCLLEPCPS
jgi:hypothetical protein